MFDAGDTGDDSEGGDHTGGDDHARPPHPSDRLWRHPSEIRHVGPAAAHRPLGAPTDGAPVARRPGRYSLGTVVVAGSLGALTMLGSVLVAGTVGTTRSTVTITDTPRAAELTATTPPRGAVIVRLTTPAGASYGAGLVVDARGDVVTTLSAPDSHAIAAVSRGTGWSDAQLVGSDPITGLTVFRPDAAALTSAATRSTAVTADRVTAPVVGSTLDLVRPDTTDRTSTSRVIATSATLTRPDQIVVGLSVLTAPMPPAATDVAVDRRSGSVLALIVPDDNPDDEISYAVPADTALSVARRISATGGVEHAIVDADIAVTAQGPVVTAVPDPGNPEPDDLRPGDLLVSLDDHEVRTWVDLVAAVVARGPGDSVDAVVIRDRRRQIVTVRLRPASRSTVPTATTISTP